MTTRIGIIHPGAMGVSIAAAARNSGNQVFWASEGRSQDTRERAMKYQLEDAGTVSRLCAECSIILSICPPHAAEDVAKQVLAAGFQGSFVDANAVAPQRVTRIGETMEQAGIAFVDGEIIGGPAWKPGTVLYLAGPRAAEIAACFTAGPSDSRAGRNDRPGVGAQDVLRRLYQGLNSPVVCRARRRRAHGSAPGTVRTVER